MARKNKSLANAFSQYEESLDHQNNKQNQNKNEQTNRQQKPQKEALDKTPPRKQEKVQENENLNHNTKSITKDEIPTRNTPAEETSVINTQQQAGIPKKDADKRPPETSSQTIREVTNTIMNMYDEKTKKETVEESHTRATFLFRKDLKKRLDNLSDGKRGFKTLFLNKAVEAMLDEVEDFYTTDKKR